MNAELKQFRRILEDKIYLQFTIYLIYLIDLLPIYNYKIYFLNSAIYKSNFT